MWKISAAASTAGKAPLMVKNKQDAVVKALATQGPTKDWEDTTVATKYTKCGKPRKPGLVEGQAMAAAATSTAGKTPLTVENVQDAVVKALTSQEPATAAFAGMHEIESGNDRLDEHTAIRASIQGATADNEGSDDKGAPREKDTTEGPDNQSRRHDYTGNLSVMALLIEVVTLLVHLGAYAGEVGSDMFTTTRMWVATTIDVLIAAFKAH